MARPLRIEYPNAWYHVMNRGRRGERVFEHKGDYEQFIEILQEAIELFALRVSAFCLMPNHYNLLVQTPDANLSRRGTDLLALTIFDGGHEMLPEYCFERMKMIAEQGAALDGDSAAPHPRQ